MLEGPRADRHASDNSGFFGAGVKLRSLRKETSPVPGQTGFAPPPVRQVIPVFLTAGRFHDPGKLG